MGGLADPAAASASGALLRRCASAGHTVVTSPHEADVVYARPTERRWYKGVPRNSMQIMMQKTDPPTPAPAPAFAKRANPLDPLAAFRADTFLETRQRIDAENHEKLVLMQARVIRDRLLDADLSDGYVCGRWTLYSENVQQLRHNGFRVWLITEVRKDDHGDTLVPSYHITWNQDPNFTFHKHHDHFMQHYATARGDPTRSSFKEVVV